MKRHHTLFIKDILEAITAIEGYTRGMDEKKFLRDGKTQSAVAWNVMIIGEATKGFPAVLEIAIRTFLGATWQK